MSKFFEETRQGLLEAIAIEKGIVPLTEISGMPAPTFRVAEQAPFKPFSEQEFLDEGSSYPSIEHAMIINNFVIKIGSQIKDGSSRVFEGNVFYQWRENGDEFVKPDVSINCNISNRNDAAFTGVPRFVMEVISEETETCDRIVKMEIYRKVGVSEYWIVDWESKILEIYLFDDDGNGGEKPYLHKTITEKNKEELQIVTFPDLHITFEELFRLDDGKPA